MNDIVRARSIGDNVGQIYIITAPQNNIALAFLSTSIYKKWLVGFHNKFTYWLVLVLILLLYYYYDEFLSKSRDPIRLFAVKFADIFVPIIRD